MQGVRNFARFYNHLLHRYKYPTQIITGGVLWCTGDILCQGLVHLAGHEDEADDGGKNASQLHTTDYNTDKRAIGKAFQSKPFEIDWVRVARMTTYGLMVSAPAYAFWYSFLDKWSYSVFGRIPPGQSPPPLPGALQRAVERIPIFRSRVSKDGGLAMATSWRTWKIIGFKLWADCFIFDPLYLTLFFSATGAMEGKSLQDIKLKLKSDFLSTYLIDIAVWAPIQTINFRFVPVPYQSLMVQSCNIGWNAYLSFVQHGAH